MTDQGWLYLLMNPSMEGLIKIGKTNRDPDNRVRELSAATGVPTPFTLVYKAYFDDCTAAENYVHTLLESNNYRVTKNREFFCVPVNIGIDAIINAKSYFDSNASISSYDNTVENFTNNQQQWQDIFELADEFYYGLGDKLEDCNEALKLYIQAYKLGSPIACLRIGEIYSKNDDFLDIQKAVFYHKEGAKRSVGECYAELAEIYAYQKHQDNAIKCWDMYFDSALIDADWKKGMYGANYIMQIKMGLIPFKHKEHLFATKDYVYSYYHDKINRLESRGLDYTNIYSDIDFASYIIENKFTTQTRIRAELKYWFEADSGGTAIDSAGKQYTVIKSNLINKDDKLRQGCIVEFNLIKFIHQNRPLVTADNILIIK